KVTQQSQLQVLARKQPDSFHFDAVARCLAPEGDKGKAVLTAGRELWFYDPKSKKPTLVSPGHFHGRFFVSDALSTSLASDYACEVEGEENIKDAGKNDVTCLRLKMKRRDKKGLSPELVEYWVDKKLLQPIRGEFFTANGKLLRTSYYAGYAKVVDE